MKGTGNGTAEERSRLFARLDDFLVRAEHGELAVSGFLSPREIHFAKAELERRGCAFFDWGGYPLSERRRLYILPEYIDTARNIDDLYEYGFSDGIAVLCVRGSGYVKLSHRDFLGALLGMGLERSVVGDIVILNNGNGEVEAFVFCEETIARFLLSEWNSVGRDKIKLELAELPQNFAPERRTSPINDTVASPRLDAVVGALCSLSREKARAAVEGELVEVDYETVVRADKALSTPCTVSVRGYGKFYVSSLSDKTKKGRFRLSAEKYL